MTDDRIDHEDTLPEALRWQLRALRTERLPTTDLWPGIAQRIATLPQQQPVATVTGGRSPRWRSGLLAVAASVLVALGIGWQFRPASPNATIDAPMAGGVTASPVAAASSLPLAARAMTIEYRAAIVELDAARPGPVRDPVLRELDRSAAEVRTALARDPDARYLLDRLQSVYARRLALTQRLAIRA